jgi:O-antigen/teichoic acid export membrane protein
VIRARQLAGASVGLGAVTIWSALLGLITTPYLIHHLGASLYGIFALITIMSAYLANLELGFGHATVRFLARARGAGDVAQERAVLETSLAVFVGAALVATTIALAASGFIVRTFVHGAQAQHHVVLDAIRIGACVMLTSLLVSFASVSLQALGRLKLIVVTRAIFGTLSSAASVTPIALGGGLRSVLVAQVLVNGALCATLLIALARTVPFRLRPRVHRVTFRAMAGFGTSVLAAGLLYQTMMQGPPTILAGNATTDQVAAYAVPSIVLQQLILLMTVSSLGFLPLASAEAVGSDRSRLAAIFRSNLRVTVLVAGPIVAFFAVLGWPILATWISSGFADHAIGPLRFLAGAALLVALGAPAADVARAAGRPSWVVAYMLAAAAGSIAGAFALVDAHGATGVAAGLCAALLVATLPFDAVVAHRLLGLRASDLSRSLAGPALAVVACAAAFAVGHLIASGFAGAVVVGAVGAAVYAAVAGRWVLDGRERAVLGALAPRGRGRGRSVEATS